MAEQSVGVKVELGVQGHDIAFAIAIQGIDLDEGRIGVHVALVELFEDVHSLGGGVCRHADGICNLLGLCVAQTGQRIDELGDDFFWRAVRHFFNVHAAFARRDKGNLLAGSVSHDRHVIFFVYVGAIFYIETTYFLAFRTSLMGFELHAQDLARQTFNVVNGFRHFHAAALAASTGVDLGLHHPNRAAQFLSGFHRFLNRKRWNAAGNGHAKLTQDFLALVLVNLHEISLGIVGWMGLFRPSIGQTVTV